MHHVDIVSNYAAIKKNFKRPKKIDCTISNNVHRLQIIILALYNVDNVSRFILLALVLSRSSQNNIPGSRTRYYA